MDISKLTIQGFKSFYEKSVFTFGKNITAVVGPNGSGKSNITEAIRFCLGEQSSKAMRGKDATDMLYRGNTLRATKAKVEIEFVRKTPPSLPLVRGGDMENVFIKEILDKDLVVVSRTIYGDGKSEYTMNGVEVRMKDLHEFLLYIHLGNKSSWHISQGEADKVLQANPQERKTIIEDALGLKVYHSRINESQRKLDKTRENIREATLKRRELMPELSALSKQVERIKRAAEFQQELQQKSSLYLNYKKEKIEKVKVEQLGSETLEILQLKLVDLEKTLGEKQKNLYKNGGHDSSVIEAELSKEERVLDIVKKERDENEQTFRRVQNRLDYLSLDEERNVAELKKTEAELGNVAAQGNDIIFAEKSVFEVRDKIESNTKQILSTTDLAEVKDLAEATDFTYKQLLSFGSVVNKDNVKQTSYLQGIRNRFQEKLLEVRAEKQKDALEVERVKGELEKSEIKLKLVLERVEDLRKQILEFKFQVSETEREIQSLTFERSRLEIQISQKVDVTHKIFEMEKEWESDLHEFKMILGNNYSVSEPHSAEASRGEEDFQNLKRNIERLKIRLEESSVTNPDEIIKNFETMTEKDNFLLSEISDLERSMINLEKLISDLKLSLKQEFDLGLLHINNIFDSYVKKLFGGGGAKVFQIELENKKKSLDENVETGLQSDAQDEVEEAKLGIEVEVEIPKKKVKGLHSLSGGERALVSIALNFSIINQNPAPFMILDETDAALDEANSKRYGEILDMLKNETKLIVVTHNRETMHFADQVYGVTLAKEGHSKVLSVSFEDAVEYAK